MKTIKHFINYIEIIQKLLVFIFLTFSIYRITYFFTDLPSLLNNFSLLDFKELDLKEYEEPLIDNKDLKIDYKKKEDIEVVLPQEEKPELKPNTSNQYKLSAILKYTGYIIGTGIIIFGFLYCMNKLGSHVDAIADVAQKGLDESNTATKEVTKAAFKAIDQSEELLKGRQEEIIKRIPKIKPKNFYQPPQR